MISSIFILIMVIGGSSSQSGMTTITAEFYSANACESARAAISAIHARDNTPVKMQGCFAKG